MDCAVWYMACCWFPPNACASLLGGSGLILIALLRLVGVTGYVGDPRDIGRQLGLRYAQWRDSYLREA
jgi:hypothetical protein